MSGIDSFTPPHGKDSKLENLDTRTLKQRQVQAENGGVNYDSIEDKSNKGGDNNSAA